ncbi:MAG: hypothetical protein DRI46_08065 [Chloroflexi bacterium]|nr:MAG: hypothetical protein DRI46_08065 [Chloroflexota bacterium]
MIWGILGGLILLLLHELLIMPLFTNASPVLADERRKHNAGCTIFLLTCITIIILFIAAMGISQ